MALTLALISDLHFGPETRFNGKLRKLTAHAAALTQAFVDQVNSVIRPDLVVNLGDDIEDESLEVDRARYAECVGILRGVNAELLHVVGNHDTENLTPGNLLSIWGTTPLQVALPGPAPAELYGSFDRGDFHFIVLHTHERRDLDISVGEAQIEFLAQDLKQNPGPTVVLMHHSAADQDLRGNPWFEGREHVALVRERKTIRGLLEAHGQVRAVFNGHVHWNHLDVIGKIPYVSLNSLTENLDEDAPGRAAATYAVVHLGLDRITVDVGGAERARYQFDWRG